MKKYFVPFLTALPSVLTGTSIMYYWGIPSSIYIQNLIYLAACSALLVLYMLRECNMKPKSICAIAAFNVLFLCSSFCFDGIEGVRRWVYLGPLALNVAFILLPVLLINIYNLSQNGYLKACYILALTIAIILFFQPDASMVTAFSTALIPFFYINYNDKLSRYIWVILFVLSCISWINIDNLEPVSYVEDILVLAKEISWIYLICCALSFLVLLFPFFKKDNCLQCKQISRSLGFFFFVLIVSTLFGNFPVPLIGYGVSPIAGYLVSVSYLEKKRLH